MSLLSGAGRYPKANAVDVQLGLSATVAGWGTGEEPGAKSTTKLRESALVS